jgi:hypothetical protein
MYGNTNVKSATNITKPEIFVNPSTDQNCVYIEIVSV